MMATWTPLHRRLLAGGILVGVLLVLWFGLIAPVLGVLAGDGSGDTQTARLFAAYRQAVAERPALEARWETLKKEEAHLPGAVTGANAALAAASLQTELKRIIDQNGGEIRSSQTLPPTKADGYEKIAIRFDLIVPQKSLQQLLYQIETHDPYLFIDRADIRSLENQNAVTGATAANPKLSIRWDVRAYRWLGDS